MLRGYGVGVLAGTNFPISPARPLRSSSQPRLGIPSTAEKDTRRVCHFSELLSNSAPQALYRTITNNQGSGFLFRVPQTSQFQPPVFWTTDSICTACHFFVFIITTSLFFFLLSPSAHWALKLMESCALKMDIITSTSRTHQSRYVPNVLLTHQFHRKRLY